MIVALDGKFKYILGTCYTPPSSNINKNQEHTNTIKLLLENADNNMNILLSGDCNLSDTKFYSNTLG